MFVYLFTWLYQVLLASHRIFLVVSGLSCPHSTWDASTLTRDQTYVPCIGRWILNHWTTREVPLPVLLQLPQVKTSGDMFLSLIELPFATNTQSQKWEQFLCRLPSFFLASSSLLWLLLWQKLGIFHPCLFWFSISSDTLLLTWLNMSTLHHFKHEIVSV